MSLETSLGPVPGGRAQQSGDGGCRVQHAARFCVPGGRCSFCTAVVLGVTERNADNTSFGLRGLIQFHLASCVTVGLFLDLFVPQFPIL